MEEIIATPEELELLFDNDYEKIKVFAKIVLRILYANKPKDYYLMFESKETK